MVKNLSWQIDGHCAGYSVSVKVGLGSETVMVVVAVTSLTMVDMISNEGPESHAEFISVPAQRSMFW